MVVKINTKGIKATQGMKDAAQDKLQIAEKFLKDGVVNLSVTSVKRTLDVGIICIYCGKMVKIEKSGDDFYYILDEIADSLKNKLEKIHAKNKKKNQKHEDIMHNATYMEETMIQGAHITKRKKAELSEMTEEEAIERMEELGHESFVFKNLDADGAVCMLYSRMDADYGIVEI